MVFLNSSLYFAGLFLADMCIFLSVLVLVY